jgi:hypothetical protein
VSLPQKDFATTMSEDLQPAPAARTFDDSVTWSEALNLLRGAAARHGTGSTADLRPLIRPAVALLAAKSRVGGLGVTELVVHLKAQWFQFPEVQRLERRDAQSLLDTVVTLLIEEYFRGTAKTT